MTGDDGTLPVSEVFGPTFQGEGPYCGRRCAFVRLGYCNLTCSWCDTPYTWDHARYDVKETSPPATVADIRDRLEPLNVDAVVLSGGEPMLWAGSRALEHLLGGPWDWDVETNGTIPPPDYWKSLVRHTTVSPKLANSGVQLSRRMCSQALVEWVGLAETTGRVAFKFVCESPLDLWEVDGLVQTYRIPERYVWVMPQGTDADTVLARHRALANAVLAAGYNTTTRLHTLLWGDERGR